MDLSAPDLAALLTAALLVGFGKTAVGPVGLVSVALFAAVLPARNSTGVLLPLLVVGDVVAVLLYRHRADWQVLWRLLPWVAVGLVAGALFVGRVGDTAMRRTIGALLLTMVAFHLWRRGHEEGAERVAELLSPSAAARLFGLLAGFATMVANAGVAFLTLYLLAARLDKLAFLGTTAWFFLLVNASKTPVSTGLGLITRESLLLDAVLAPAVLVGALLGYRLIQRLDQKRFQEVAVVTTGAASASLLT